MHGERRAHPRRAPREIDARLRLWRLEPALAASAVPALRARHALVFAQKERTYRVTATTDTPDPLQTDEWWLSQIGISGLTAPGPGVPVTIVDSGLDVAHPEFLGRADTQALNAQEPAPFGGEHGTMVSSVIAAPVNGVGLVGDLPARGAPLLGRREGRRHASRVERDLGRAPRRGAGGA